MTTKGLLAVLRGIASFVLVLGGIALFLYSIPVSSGFGHKQTSLGGTFVALVGLSLILGGYWLVRSSEGAPLPAICLKFVLALGSTFLVFGPLILFFGGEHFPIPTGYLIAVGCICAFGFVKFRAYTRDH
jgi:hypothetical protein